MLSKLLEGLCQECTSLKSLTNFIKVPHNWAVQGYSTQSTGAWTQTASGKFPFGSHWFKFVQLKIASWHILKLLAHIVRLLNRLYLIGTLRNYDSNVNVKKAIGLMSKATTLHVHNSFFTFLCHPCQLWPKMTRFQLQIQLQLQLYFITLLVTIDWPAK